MECVIVFITKYTDSAGSYFVRSRILFNILQIVYLENGNDRE